MHHSSPDQRIVCRGRGLVTCRADSRPKRYPWYGCLDRARSPAHRHRPGIPVDRDCSIIFHSHSSHNMSHWPCSVSGCNNGALLGRPGTCSNCTQHFCFDHIEDVDKHPCSSKKIELKQQGKDHGDRAWEERVSSACRVWTSLTSAQRSAG